MGYFGLFGISIKFILESLESADSKLVYIAIPVTKHYILQPHSLISKLKFLKNFVDSQF